MTNSRGIDSPIRILSYQYAIFTYWIEENSMGCYYVQVQIWFRKPALRRLLCGADRLTANHWVLQLRELPHSMKYDGKWLTRQRPSGLKTKSTIVPAGWFQVSFVRKPSHSVLFLSRDINIQRVPRFSLHAASTSLSVKLQLSLIDQPNLRGSLSGWLA